MVNNILRGFVYFVVLVLLQVLVLNNIHFFRIAIPFLYIYFIIKLPIGTSRTTVLTLSFIIGFFIDIFSNTPGLHSAACTFAGFTREYFLWLFMDKDLPEGADPSYRTLGYGGFFKYTLAFVTVHTTVLYLIESFALFDPLFLIMRIVGSATLTTLLICVVEAFHIERLKSVE